MFCTHCGSYKNDFDRVFLVFDKENHFCCYFSLWMEHGTELWQVQYTYNIMDLFVEAMKLLSRLELMTGSGRRCRAVEMAEDGEDLQIDEVLTPEENR